MKDIDQRLIDYDENYKNVAGSSDEYITVPTDVNDRLLLDSSD